MAQTSHVRSVTVVALLLALVGMVTVAAAAGPRRASATPSSVRMATLPQQVPSDFTHRDHETLACFTCHENTAGHGALTVTTIEDCRACHHESGSDIACSRCHATPPDGRFEVVRSVSFSVPSGDPARSLPFTHDRHGTIECARCHTDGSELGVSDELDCASCHDDHHTVDSDCASCHAPVHVSRHPSAEVHLTCSGATCHQDVPFESLPRTRAFCLGCHREMALHEAPRECAACHILPAPRGSR